MGRRHDLRAGVVVIQPVPGVASLQQLGEELLLALGKALVGVHPRPPATKLWSLAEVWMAAERVRHLVVLGSDRLAAPLWETLQRSARVAGRQLWLVVDGAGPAAKHLHCLGEPVRVLTLAEALAELPAPVRSATQLKTTSVLPSDDFFTFRASCRDLLEPELFKDVDATYRRAFADTLKWYGSRSHPESHRVAEYLSKLTAEARNPAEALVRLRAAQAACVRRGRLVRLLPQPAADPDRWAYPAPRLVKGDQAFRLRRVWSPQVACILVLASVLVMPSTLITGLTLDSVAPAGDHVSADGRRWAIPPQLQAPIRAQVLDRRRHGADGKSPLLERRTTQPLAELARQLRMGQSVAAMDDVDPAVWFAWRRPLPEAMRIDITRMSARPFLARWKA